MSTGEGTKVKLVAAVLVLGFMQAATGRAQERMPPIPQEKMTEAQKKAFADYKDLRKSNPTGPPWSVLLRVPDLEVPALQMRLHYLNNSVLSQKLVEFAIFLAARQWTNNWEFSTHYNAGVKAGLSPATIAAVADGRRPEHMVEDEEIMYEFCTELLHNQSVSDTTYARALAKFGEPGVVEAASIEGYYAFLGMVMNAVRVTVPPGTKPPLAPFPTR